jgi:hypothetical protein
VTRSYQAPTNDASRANSEKSRGLRPSARSTPSVSKALWPSSTCANRGPDAHQPPDAVAPEFDIAGVARSVRPPRSPVASRAKEVGVTKRPHTAAAAEAPMPSTAQAQLLYGPRQAPVFP